jgi:AcrR family transcriptional regulator
MTEQSPSRGDHTRTLILQAALELFDERGYDKTTMRAIAEAAGVSVGNAYYYFASKDHLVHGFYQRIAELHADAVSKPLARQRAFASRLRSVLMAWIDVAAPYHEFGAQLFANAADPASPLSPFSAESSTMREAAIAIFRETLDGSTAKLDPHLRAELPELLWLYHMGIVLFWIHDQSDDCARTRLLIRRTVPIIDRLVGLSRLRVLRPITRDAIDIVTTLRHLQQPPSPT